jgi:Tfp pilus assembly protein PilN
MRADFIDINLLPRPVRATLAGTPWRRLMLPGLMMLVLALLLVLGASLLKVRNDRALAEQRAQLLSAQQGVNDFSTLLTEVKLLQEQVTTLATQAEQLEADAERVERENPSLAPFLRALTETLLPRMTITGIVTEMPDRYIVSGEAGSNALVIEYVNALKRNPQVREVLPRTIERLGDDAPPGAVRWVLEVAR